MQYRTEIACESVLEKDADTSDGLGADMLRMGAGMKTKGPDPQATGGQYCLVLNGSMVLGGETYPMWSLVYASRTDPALEMVAGARGLEVLVLSFPRPEQ